MLLSLKHLALALLLGTAVVAKADTLDYFVFTDGTQTISFALPVSPTPSEVSPNCRNTGPDAFCIYDQTIEVNGVATLADLDFFNDNNSGGIFFLLANQDIPIINQDSVPLFSGSLTAPTFLLGTFAMTNEQDSGPTNEFGTNFTATIGATPEPSSIVLLGTGLLTVCGAVRRKVLPS